MAELRPHLDADGFAGRIRRQQASGGYQLAFLEASGAVQTLAGFRFADFLAWGKVLYVDDFVTTAAARSTGCGQEMFDWLVQRAREARCDALHLDSGVQKHGAHRFYLRNRMDITCHHFSLTLA